MKNTRTAANDTRTGLLLTIISAASFGVMPILARYVYNVGAEPITVFSLGFTIVAVMLLATSNNWQSKLQ